MTDAREHLVWHRRCGNGACIEVAHDSRSERPHVLVRDSENAAGPRLDFTTNAWTSFLRAVRQDDLN
jgi:hypothetical protein